MDEQTLRHLRREVEEGRLSRRRFTQSLIGLGLTAPMAAQVLGTLGTRPGAAQGAGLHADPTGRGRGRAHAVVAGADPAQPALRHRHEGHGRVPDLLRAARRLRPEGNLVPVLAAEVPSAANGGLAKDGTSVTWRLKKNVRWHDGKPFSADDVVFTWEFVSDPATAAVTVGLVPRDRADRQGRQPRHQDHVQPAAALLGRCLLRQSRHDPAQARVREFQGRQVPGGAGEPEARGDRRLPHRGLPARRRRSGRA